MLITPHLIWYTDFYITIITGIL
uniref:NADH dehydrogenase subunit 1 n=1 Tax=Heterorhabditis bacteriophora TaxID=37862 RepID=A0A1I7X3C0_HETBA